MKPKYYLASADLMGVVSCCVLLTSLILGTIVSLFWGWLALAMGLLIGSTLFVVWIEPPVWLVFWLAKAWGYDGVELLLTNRTITKLKRDLRHFELSAVGCGLEISYHQPWDIPDLFQRITVLLGIMPRPEQFGQNLGSVLALGVEPVVVHGNRLSEIPEGRFRQVEIEVVDDTEVPHGVCRVLDVFYSLHQLTRAPGGFKTEQIIETWGRLINSGPCRRLHLYNYLPGAGLLAKNRPPDDGILPISRVLKIHNWEIVVLELNPIIILRDMLLGFKAPTKSRMVPNN